MPDRMTEEEVEKEIEKARASWDDIHVRNQRSKIGIVLMVIFDTTYYLAILHFILSPWGGINFVKYLALFALPAANGFIFFTKYVVFRNKVNENYVSNGLKIIFAFLIITGILVFAFFLLLSPIS